MIWILVKWVEWINELGMSVKDEIYIYLRNAELRTNTRRTRKVCSLLWSVIHTSIAYRFEALFECITKAQHCEHYEDCELREVAAVESEKRLPFSFVWRKALSKNTALLMVTAFRNSSKSKSMHTTGKRCGNYVYGSTMQYKRQITSSRSEFFGCFN